jgi:hypothetical protein
MIKSISENIINKLIMVNLKMTNFKGKENIFGIMEECLLENGITVKLANLENLFGLMGVVI